MYAETRGQRPAGPGRARCPASPGLCRGGCGARGQGDGPRSDGPPMRRRPGAATEMARRLLANPVIEQFDLEAPGPLWMAAPTPLAGSSTSTRPATTTQSWRDWQGRAARTGDGRRVAPAAQRWAALVLALPHSRPRQRSTRMWASPQGARWIAPWEREDALWYEKIAALRLCATEGTTAFFPLLPLLMRLVSVLTGAMWRGRVSSCGVASRGRLRGPVPARGARHGYDHGRADRGLSGAVPHGLFPVFGLYRVRCSSR